MARAPFRVIFRMSTDDQDTAVRRADVSHERSTACVSRATYDEFNGR
jgi:hypothetical protein